MSQQKFTPPRLVLNSKSAPAPGSVRRPLSPPRRHPDYVTLHQYQHREGQLFTIVIYDKDHDDSPYLHYWVVNVPGKQASKGKEIFKLEKVIIDSKHRYVSDIYLQTRGKIVPDTSYDDDKRRSFPMAKLMEALGNELVSRQEFYCEQSDPTKIFLT